jgi:hypothetical protein
MRKLLLVLLCVFAISAKSQTSFTICAGSPLTLTAVNSASLTNTVYSISPGTGTFITNTFVVTPTISTTYTLFVGGITAGNTPTFTSSQVTVNVYPFSQFFYSVSGTFTLGCASKSLAVVDIGINNAPSMSYTVNGPVGVPQPSFSTSTNTLSIYLTSVGAYTTTVLQASSGCTTKLAFSILNNAFNPPLNLNIPTTVINCSNSPIALSISPSTLNLQSTWQTTASVAAGPSVQIGATSPATASLVTIYTLTIVDTDNLCESQTVIPVYQNLASPSLIIAPPQKQITCAQPTIFLINQSTSGSAPGFPANQPVVITSVVGPTTSNTPGSTFPVSTAGIYTVGIFDMNNGCSNTGTIEVFSAQNYPVFQTPLPAYNLCAQSSITISPVVTSGPVNFLWTFPAGASSQVQPDGSIVVLSPGVYTAAATNSLGCSSTELYNVVYCVGLEKNKFDHTIILGPNPVHCQLNVQLSQPVAGTWRIFTITGKLILEGTAEASDFTVPTENLKEGLYLFSITSTNGKEWHRKIVKQN